MAINVTWDGTTYSIPQSGEFNWSSLTNFLVALGQKAAVAGEMKQEIRKATTSPVTISAASDYAIVTDLTVAGPVAVNLPAGSPGQIFVIVDGKADAATNNITITRAGSETIAGQPTLVMNKDRQVVMLQYNSGDTDWKLINYAIPPGQVTDSDISGTISTAGKVSGSAITSGTIGGSTAINTSGALTIGGATALNGGVTLGDAGGDALTINSTAVTLGASLNFDSNTLVIDAVNDRVGIGTATPSQALDVVGTVNATTVAASTVNAGALNASGNTALGDASSDVLTINGTAVTLPNGLNFDSNTLVIDAANNRVGVGIASPTVALDVVGAAKVSTDLTVNGNTTLGDATTDTLTIAGNATQNGVGFLKVASGATADRPGSPVNGMIRYNSDLTAFEGYAANAWSAIGGGGTVDKVTQASHGFVSGDIGKALYLNASAYTFALASAANTAEVVGVISRIIDSNNFEITLSGEISGLTGLVAGEVYFLSASSAGVLTTTEPTTVGQVSIPVGIASSTTTLYVAPKRGVVVGGANARTQISLPNNTTQVVQDVSIYDAGELAGWVYIDGTTDLRFYVQAQFVKGGDNIYDLAYQVTGDTPPAGFSMTISNVGVISVTLPSIAGYVSASINYALNAPAVGTNFPLTVDGANVTVASATTQGVVSTTTQTFAGAKSFIDNINVGFTNGPLAPTANRRYLSLKGAGTTAGDGNAALQLTSNAAYTTTPNLGNIEWHVSDNTASSSTRAAFISSGVVGSTANNVGAVLAFATKTDGVSGSGTERMQLSANGNLLINRTTEIDPSYKLQVRDGLIQVGRQPGTINGNYFRIDAEGSTIVSHGISSSTSYDIVNLSNGVRLVQAGTSWAAISDERQKKNIKSLEYGLEQIEALRPVRFDYKTEESEESKRLGFIAQEVKSFVKEAVQGSDETEYSVTSSDFIPILVKAIQELKAELDAVKADLIALKN